MSEIVLDAIATQTAAIVAVAEHAAAPLGYGADLSCADDLDENMLELTGDDRLVLAQALVRRLDCPRGAHPDDPNYGVDLRSYCNRPTTDAEVRALGGQIRLEVQKDDRVESASVVVRPSDDARTLAIELLITPVPLEDVDPSPFTLTLTASSAQILIEEIRSAA